MRYLEASQSAGLTNWSSRLLGTLHNSTEGEALAKYFFPYWLKAVREQLTSGNSDYPAQDRIALSDLKGHKVPIYLSVFALMPESQDFYPNHLKKPVRSFEEAWEARV